MRTLSSAKRSSRINLAGGGVIAKVLIAFVAAVLVVVVGGGFAISGWLKSYLRSEELLSKIQDGVAESMRAECEIESLTWTGNSVYSDRVDLTGATGAWFSEIEATGVRVDATIEGVRRGTCKVSKAKLDRIGIFIGETRNGRPVERELPSTGFLASFAPSSYEWERLEASEFELVRDVDGNRLELSKVHLKAKPLDSGGLDLRGRGGKLVLPGGASFDLQFASVRATSEGIYINDIAAEGMAGSRITGAGDIPYEGEKNFRYQFTGLDLEKVVSEALRGKVQGLVEGKMTTTMTGDSIVHEGDLVVTKALLDEMQVLEDIAEHTDTDRFRRLSLDHVVGHIWQRGNKIKITDLVLRADSLITIEGDLNILGEHLDGTFQVGVDAAALRWIPGAEKKVFVEKRDGLVWAPMRVTGTRSNPQNDLSRRLRNAAIFTTIEEAPGKAIDAASGAATGVVGALRGTSEPDENGEGESSTQSSVVDRVIDGGRGVVEDAAKGVVEEATGFLPFFK